VGVEHDIHTNDEEHDNHTNDEEHDTRICGTRYPGGRNTISRWEEPERRNAREELGSIFGGEEHVIHGEEHVSGG
jgi:hypothetical protein